MKRTVSKLLLEKPSVQHIFSTKQSLVKQKKRDYSAELFRNLNVEMIIL